MSAVTFSANGKPKTAREGSTIDDLLHDLQLAPLQVVIEYNGEPLAREQFASTRVLAGDRIEIAQMVGGG